MVSDIKCVTGIAVLKTKNENAQKVLCIQEALKTRNRL